MTGWITPLIDINPFNWLGDAASEGLADGFTSMMMAVWSASLWLLTTVFALLDRFTTPDVRDPGLRTLYGSTVWISAVIALFIGLGQIGLAAVRRDGRSLGTVAVGLAQYAAALAGWLVVAAGVISSCAAIATGLLDQLVGVDDFGGFPAGAGWEVKASGTVEATVLGICGLFVLIPAAVGYLLIMLVREAALLVLTATMPIAAAGALGDGTRRWMWTAIRWFLAACLTSPLLALVLGVGVRIGESALPATATDADTAASIGTAVVGCVTMLVACVCPMALFRLLAFVDPGTASGASMRSSLAANGGVAGLFGGAASNTGDSSAASQPAPDGRSSSEGAADAGTTGRFGSVASVTTAGLGQGIRQIAETGRRGAAVSADVLGQSGVGHQGYYDTSPAPSTTGDRSRPSSRLPQQPGETETGGRAQGASSSSTAEAAEAAEFLA
jgi:type IV secretion system protein TrbL